MTIPQVLLVAIAAIGLILAVFFHKHFFNILFKIKDSFHDFFLSFKYGNFTEREETVCDIYLNYHYPVYTPYNGKCSYCKADVTAKDSPRCPICGIYICLECGSCHHDCFNRDEKILAAEREINVLLKGKKKKAMKRRIDAVKSRSNDKHYYCVPVEADFPSDSQ